MTNFVMLPEYKEVIASLKTNPLTFVSGSAGTGKSTLINYIRSKVDKCLLLAPTGIAALNIGGKTIHSVCKFPPHFIKESDIKSLSTVHRAYFTQINLLILDEISMASSNLIDSLNIFLQKNRGIFEPFGGVHVMFVGDLFQLPPIVNDDYSNSNYDSEYFFDSHIVKYLIQQNKFKMVKLNKVLRQSDDMFVTILNNIRTGKNISNTVNVLNKLVKVSDEMPDGYIQITPYNDISDVTNKRKLESIDSQIKTYFGKVNNFNLKNCTVPQVLSLKIGAQVMLSKNLPSKGLVNGQHGKVVNLNESSVVVKFNNGDVHEIEESIWEEKSLPNAEGKITTTGTFLQIPLKLSWSITIHKVQSTTIDKLYIDMDRGAFAPGMLYVALSRARSLNGLIVSKYIDETDIIVDQRCINFYNTH